MANSEHPDGAGEIHRPFRCTFGPVREKDLVWPPPDEDVDAFTVVRLDDVDAPPAPPIQPVKPIKLSRPIKPTFGDCRAPGLAPRIRPLVVSSVPPPLPQHPQSSTAVTESPVHPPEIPADAPAIELAPPISIVTADPESTTASRSAWLAVLFAAACAILAVVEYRMVVLEEAEVGLAMAEPPPMPQGVSPADLAPSVRVARPSAAPTPATKMQPPTTQLSATQLPATQPPATQPPAPQRPTAQLRMTQSPKPRPAKARVARSVTPEPTRPVTLPQPPRPTPPRVIVARADAPATRAVPAAPASGPSAVDTSTAASISRPMPAPTPTPVPDRVADAPSFRPVAVVATAAVDVDEADIRSTLSRFRTAYSQLDAQAARDVWPSVDARALERAFQSLKSQHLRFERCSLTVTGARAQASCKGRATYVPRIGDQSPRFTAREWTFELRKADERWTIASARTL